MSGLGRFGKVLLPRTGLAGVSPGSRMMLRPAPQRSFHSTVVKRGGYTKTGKEYNYFKVPHVSNVHKIGGEVMMTVMWLWIFYRAKNDLVYVLGFKHPWDDHH